MARRLGIPLLDDLDAALARDDVHVVSICAEPQRRGPIIVRAAQAGKHLYLDKPLAATIGEADAIVAACRTSGVVSHMWSMVRAPVAATCRELAESGRLGELVAVHCDMTFAKGPAATAALGKPRRETAAPQVYELVDSKRELTNVGVYPLVMLLWLTGRGVRRVRATSGNYFFREHQANDMEDFGQILLEMDGGLVATVSAGRTGWRSHPAGGLNRVCLVGTKDAAVVDADWPRVAVWADVDAWTAPERDPEDPMGMWGGPKPQRYAARPKTAWFAPPSAAPADAAYFLDCIERGRASDVSAALAAHATEALLAAYQSAADGRMVELPLARKST
jgi:predicted dehydrogenase